MAEFRIEVRVQALKSVFGLIDHYYMILDDKEYHPGMYAPGSILPKDSTKGYHVAAIRTVCQLCHDKLVLNLNAREDKRIWSFFPLLNCESISTGFSIQSVVLVLILPIVTMLLLQRKILITVIAVLLGLLVHLSVSKYMFSRTVKTRCSHL